MANIQCLEERLQDGETEAAALIKMAEDKDILYCNTRRALHEEKEANQVRIDPLHGPIHELLHRTPMPWHDAAVYFHNYLVLIIIMVGENLQCLVANIGQCSISDIFGIINRSCTAGCRPKLRWGDVIRKDMIVQQIREQSCILW